MGREMVRSRRGVVVVVTAAAIAIASVVTAWRLGRPPGVFGAPSAQARSSPTAAASSPVPLARPWTSSVLIITAHALGAVTIGMTVPQAAAAAGQRLTEAGDGVFYPVGGLGRGLSVRAIGPAGTVDCVSANDRGGGGPAVTTAQGFALGGTVAQLKSVYGSKLRFVPAPPAGGIAPFPGYVVSFPDGNLVFWVASGRVGQIAGGPGRLPSDDCA